MHVLEILLDVVDKQFLVQHERYKIQSTWGALHFHVLGQERIRTGGSSKPGRIYHQ